MKEELTRLINVVLFILVKIMEDKIDPNGAEGGI